MTAIDRARFVGGSAAALTAANAVTADAQTTNGFGKPHPPIVSETDPAIATQTIKLVRPDATIGAYVAMPKNVTATTPGVVLCVHIWGADATLRDLARRYAKEGYIAILPGLFDRYDPPSGDGANDIGTFSPIAQKMYAAGTQTGDLLAAHDRIRARTSGKIGIYGNCMGGGVVLQAIAGNSNYGAASEFYGYVRADRKATQPAPPEAFAWADTVTTPVIGSYAANDGGIAAADIETAFARFKAPHDVKIYPGTAHGFFDDTRDRYDAAAAADAWARTLAWFGKYLKTP